ncbi:MAG TPA: class I SAM-dependent methyltransferase [Edaphobacter sp.]|jgi:SAM-dependent methyltransferase
MTQNIYDDPEFFRGYARMARSVEGLAGAPEWPAMRALLPNLRALRVLDLGCGFGWFCRWAHQQGAASVRGLDVSRKMLEKAARDFPSEGIEYLRTDLESVNLPVAAFDLVYSSLALHYIEDLGLLFERIHTALAPGGSLVFSIEHPIYMAPQNPQWSTDEKGRRSWPLDSYFLEGPRITDWLAPGVVKHHRTLGTTLNLLLHAGLSIAQVEEWRPTSEQIAARPELAEELDRPMFLLIAAQKESL